MKKLLLALLLVSGISTAFAQAPEPEADNDVQWHNFEEATGKLEKEPRLMFFDVYTDWCGWCKRMDQTTFSNPVISRLLNESFYPIKFDAEQKEEIVFRGRTFKFIANGRRGYHELAGEILGGKLSYPTVVVIDENFNIVQSIPGYRTAPEMEQILKFFSTGAYKTTAWEKFKSETTFELGE